MVKLYVLDVQVVREVENGLGGESSLAVASQYDQLSTSHD